MVMLYEGNVEMLEFELVLLPATTFEAPELVSVVEVGLLTASVVFVDSVNNS